MNEAPAADLRRAVPPSGSLLLVEDDDGDAFLVEGMLLEAGSELTLVRARTLAEALPLLADSVACVLLDLALPDAHGLEALHAILGEYRDAAVVCFTGLADERRGAEAVAAGAQDYLVKGRVDAERLDRAIRYATVRRRADEQARLLYVSRLRAEENARLERGLLPIPHVRDRDLVVTTRYLPGRGQVIGGDFYDVVEAADGTLYVLIGDVAGHGPDEAALGVCLRIGWRALVLSGVETERILPVLEEVLVQERRSDEVFTTLTMLVVAPDRRRANLWLAGHLAPIRLDPRPAPLPTDRRGPALGLLSASTWRPRPLTLEPGWRLMLYTDGLVEGRAGRAAQRLGVPGLLELIGTDIVQSSTGDMLDGLLSRVHSLNGGLLEDDVAIVIVESSSRGRR